MALLSVLMEAARWTESERDNVVVELASEAVAVLQMSDVEYANYVGDKPADQPPVPDNGFTGEVTLP